MDNVLDADRPVEGRFVHYPIFRYKRALNDDSFFGAIYAGQEFEHHFNRLGGFDEQLRVGPADMLESSIFFPRQRPIPLFLPLMVTRSEPAIITIRAM
jgi:hypothetical protein